MSQAESLKSSYIDWLKKELIFTDIEDGYISISTPFVDNNYDNIELFAKFVSESQIEVTDFGETLFNLEDNGLKITKQSKTIYRLFENTLNDFGIEYNCNTETLSITTDVRRFPTAKNRLLQAIIRINDLGYLIKENVNATFNDILSSFLIDNKILFSPNVEIVGKKWYILSFRLFNPLTSRQGSPYKNSCST